MQKGCNTNHGAGNNGHPHQVRGMAVLNLPGQSLTASVPNPSPGKHTKPWSFAVAPLALCLHALYFPSFPGVALRAPQHRRDSKNMCWTINAPTQPIHARLLAPRTPMPNSGRLKMTCLCNDVTKSEQRRASSKEPWRYRASVKEHIVPNSTTDTTCK